MDANPYESPGNASVRLKRSRAERRRRTNATMFVIVVSLSVLGGLCCLGPIVLELLGFRGV